MARNLLPIGQFSKVCRLTVKALRYYEERGILRPAMVDPGSGYRYYSVAQATEAEWIRQLRALDMPLDEIKRVVHERDADQVRTQLAEHRRRIEARAAECERILDFLQQLLDPEGAIMSYEIKVKEMAPQQVIAVRRESALERLSEDLGQCFGLVFGYLGQLNEAPAGPPMCIYHGDEHMDDLEIELAVPCSRPLAGQGELRGRVLEGGRAASTLHAGPYQEVGPAYQELMAWIREHGHDIAGPPRETYLVGPDTAKDPAEYRTEIVWPIR